MILGVDTGGTFTDFVLLTRSSSQPASSSSNNNTAQSAELRTHKVLSTPGSPERAILQGIEEMGLAAEVATGQVKIIHGSTVATNAALEGKGVKTAFITNTGFRDLLTIGRQTRPELYLLETPPISSPVSRALCLEADGRIDSLGNELVPLNQLNLEALLTTLNQQKPDAVAISLLFSFLDPGHEMQIARFLAENLDYSPFITYSHEVLPEYREYERGIATWLNASLGPLVKKYLLNLKNSTQPSRLSVMQSSGGTIDADQAARKSVNLLLSGPAGGLAAASFLAELTGQSRLMTFDMGGTSTDVALLDGKINLTTEGRIGDFPVAVPMVDMHTIGAGGGSIALIDAGGLLQVGPQSAGASPGPACYGLGGTRATVTDANLVLGRLQPDSFLGGTMHLDVAAANEAISPIALALSISIEDAASGIIKVANEHMARALRVISVARGHDPKSFRLCCFGGAGGLHICALAEAMGMNDAMVPVNAGVLSAMGMFLAPVERQLSQTCQGLLQSLDKNDIEQIFARLAAQGLEQLKDEGLDAENTRIERQADLRYAGQSTSLTIDWTTAVDAEEQFHISHEHRYGHRLTASVELVNLRLSVSEQKDPPVLAQLEAQLDQAAVNEGSINNKMLYGISQAVPLIQRSTLLNNSKIRGPALIVESNATTWLASGWHARCDPYGNLMLMRDNPATA
ncbi:hydantoinase/oxoprolinase family protein [Gammaproteobacteria bacterium]|nr:hydantoinase/oxoprolinase family protein [Gammaproteobacteria bacterium]